MKKIFLVKNYHSYGSLTMFWLILILLITKQGLQLMILILSVIR